MNSDLLFEDGLTRPSVIEKKQKVGEAAKHKRVIVLAGPTGVGKTDLSLSIAQVIGGEVISADSMQVYRGMDIGTAKASKKQRTQIVHHLIDARDLEETYNVYDFYQEARQALREVLSKDHVPIVVGGTGFYINALLCGPPGGPPSVPHVRERLELEMESKGPVVMYEILSKQDPEYAATITHRDRQKIIRALEIIFLSQQKVSQFAPLDPEEHYDFRCWFIYMPKEVLYPRIDMRCEKMIGEGFIEEVKRLAKEGLLENSSASQAIGYRQCLDYLRSPQAEGDWEKFKMAFKQASRRYAKRQFTWFRKEPLFRWLDLHTTGIDTAVEMILHDFELRL